MTVATDRRALEQGAVSTGNRSRFLVSLIGQASCADAEQAVHSLADQIKRDEHDVMHAEPDDREAAAVIGGGAPRFERRNLPGAGGGSR